ncbi:MAG: peptidoglycan DD-metalloendopeptidase family protein [Chloroflexota bacterium]
MKYLAVLVLVCLACAVCAACAVPSRSQSNDATLPPGSTVLGRRPGAASGSDPAAAGPGSVAPGNLAPGNLAPANPAPGDPALVNSAPANPAPGGAGPGYATPVYPAAYAGSAARPTASPSPTADPLVSFRLCSPLDDIQRRDLPRLVSAGYTGPPPGSDARHEGTDFAFYNWKGHYTIDGNPVTALMAGQVSAALDGTFPYGSFVIIETPSSWIPADLKAQVGLPEGSSLYHLYAHLQDGSLQAALGQRVEACQVIGRVGKTGNTLAAHLHLETRTGPPGASFAMMSAFTETATPDEKKNYRLWRVSRQYLHFDPLLLLGYGIAGWPTPPPGR